MLRSLLACALCGAVLLQVVPISAQYNCDAVPGKVRRAAEQVARLPVAPIHLHITSPGSCDCWRHVGRWAATNNGHACAVPAASESWVGGDYVNGYPKMVFCSDMPEFAGANKSSAGEGPNSCSEDFSASWPPCSQDSSLQGCWVPYIKSSAEATVFHERKAPTFSVSESNERAFHGKACAHCLFILN